MPKTTAAIKKPAAVAAAKAAAKPALTAFISVQKRLNLL